MAQDLTAELFQSLLGSRFTLSGTGSEPFEAELAEVTLLEAHDGPRHQPFSVVFLDLRKIGVLPQQIFHLEHPTLGATDLFLVPLGPASRGMRYEAVFN